MKKAGEPGHYCPLLKKDCIEGKCTFWTHVRGKSPQGGDIDHYGCAIAWLPVLLIENASESRKTQADVESFRNEVAATIEAFSPGSRGRIEEARRRIGLIK